MNETISFLAPVILSIIASLVFFLLARRENAKASAMVAQMEERFHRQVEERIRRMELGSFDSAKAPLP